MKALSIMPYYGGKARMAHFIAERLNYDDTDTFVTPFGGACRVLLNKPRHSIECYNDYSVGLCKLIEILSKPDETKEFIHRLYDTAECSEERFIKAKEIHDLAEADLEQWARKKVRDLLVNNKIVSAQSVNIMLDVMIYDVLDKAETSEKKDSEKRRRANLIKKLHRPKSTVPTQKGMELFKQKLTADTNFKCEFQTLFTDWISLYHQKEEQGSLDRAINMGFNYTDMELAEATFITYTQSRDAMGLVWSKEKFKSVDAYRKRILNLYRCAERLEDVQVYTIDGIEFFRRRKFVDAGDSIVNIHPEYRMLNEWFFNSSVMMCCDPSYISPEDERKKLEGIDWKHESSLTEAIKNAEREMPKNLGKIYAKSFEYPAQENFLKCIQNAKCKIIVSNYDLILYNKYLNESTGWRRCEYVTKTSVGSKENNVRVEVLWYNY
jgi:predicted DNA-binding protein (UPF0251 family)